MKGDGVLSILQKEQAGVERFDEMPQCSWAGTQTLAASSGLPTYQTLLTNKLLAGGELRTCFSLGYSPP